MYLLLLSLNSICTDITMIMHGYSTTVKGNYAKTPSHILFEKVLCNL